MKLLALIKKEFSRFFSDPKLIITMIIPGVLIFVIYSLMGTFMNEEDEGYDFKVYRTGDSVAVSMLKAAVEATEGYTLTFEDTTDAETAKTAVKDGKYTAYIVFSEAFDEAVGAYEAGSGKPAPTIEIYYRSGDSESMSFYSIATSVLDAYESALANKFDINRGDTVYDYSDAGKIVQNVMAGIMPFIIVIFIFSACMSITLESVAGEKERGTLATVLVTSVPRVHVALGKVIPLSCIALIGAVSSFLGMVLSLPKIIGVSVGSFVGSFGFLSYFMLLLLILSLVPLIVAIISVISTASRTVKESSGYTSVIMIITMVLSLVASFVSGIGGWSVVVPILNAVVAMQNILTGSYVVWQCLVSVLMNLVYTAVIVFVMAKMLSSERIMFGK